MSLNLAVILRESALAAPAKTAVVFDDLRLTYQQLDELSSRVAAGLRASGIRGGDRVGLMLPNVPQFLASYYGILKAGGVVVPMNVLLKAPEVSYYLEDSGARVLIAWEDFAEAALEGAASTARAGAGGGVVTYVAGRPGDGAAPAGSRRFQELLRGEPGFEMEPTEADGTAVILYTSGTTGRPKGAELTHFSMFMNCRTIADLFGTRADDVVLSVLPLFHSFGQTCVMNATIYEGGTLTLLPRFEPARVLEIIQRDRVSVFAGVPTMFYGILNHPETAAYDTSSLRMCGSGGSSMPGEVLKAFEKRFGVYILEGYGLSETSPVATFNVSLEQRRVLSIGKPVWGVELRILDEREQVMPPGKDSVGEIVIRGHNVMKGYYNKPKETAEAFKGGWFHTGDLGYVDDDGYYFIVDRKKDLILRGGYNVYPREVEEVLYEHPAVAEAAVIGVPDQRLGEEVKAVLALKAGQSVGAEELIGFCRDRLAAYKYPRSIDFVEVLPKGPTGKVLKKELKSAMAAAPVPEAS
ncbi:MAG: long-chain-fatty-acid--CoA ligase [Candidatus Dormibacteraceae bacterium]